MINENYSLRKEDNFGTVCLVLSICIVISLYWRWAMPGAITWGDWFFVTNSAISDYLPALWNGAAELGIYDVISAPFFPLLTLQGILARVFHFGYPVIERLVWFYPFVFFIILSPYLVARTLGFHRLGTAVTILVFNLNTYIFFTGGQMTIGMANALGPLVLAVFIRVVRNPRFLTGLLFALAAALQMVYDMRIFYVTFLLCSLYLLYSLAVLLPRDHRYLWRLSKVLLLAGMTICLFHSYWLIPLLSGCVFNTNASLLQASYANPAWVHTLSYMTLLHSLGVHVPWWGRPDVVNTINPQFLILPMLSFSVLLFRKLPRTITFFSLSAIVFSFLVKGSNPPFGEFYIWLFKCFPGFLMFRTPGKFYMPLVLSYAVMLGYLVNRIVKPHSINYVIIRLSQRLRSSLFFVRVTLFIICISALFIIFPVQPLSVLKYKQIWISLPVPEESAHIENFLHSQPNFFRTLWIPAFYRFGYSSGQHPALSGVNLAGSVLFPLRFINPPDYPYISSYLGQPFSTFLLRLLSVKYVLVPFELHYDIGIYYWYGYFPEHYYRFAKKTPGLKPVSFKGRSQLYEVPDPFPHFYVASDSIAVTAKDIGVLPTITETEAIGNIPLFLLADQLSEKMFKKMNSFIFQNSSWQDLAIQVTGHPETIHFRQSGKAGKLQVTGQNTQVNIKKPGMYEIWFDKSEIEDEIPELEIKIDGKTWMLDTEYSILDEERKYIKIGEGKLEEGKHIIKIKNQNTKIKMAKQNLEIIIVNKQEKEKAGKIIWERINSPEVEVRYILSKGRKFYVPQRADYIIKAKVSPCLFRKKESIGAEFNLGIEEELKEWRFRPLRVAYSYSIKKGKTLVVSVYFDGDKREDEFVHMKNENIRVDLEKYPYFELKYRIENPEVQTIEVVVGIDFDKDGKVNEYIRGIYPKPASIWWSDFRYNFYTKAKKNFPGEKYYEVLDLEIYPHKIWKVDCSTPKRKGKYRFWIKGLQFYNYNPEEFFKSFKDALDVDLNSKEERKKWSIKSKDVLSLSKTDGATSAIPKSLRYLELSRPIDKINLKQFPVIELNCKIKEPELQNIEFILGLDFNGDTVVDKEISLDYFVTSKDWGQFQFDAYTLVKDIYPDEKEYNLMQIRLGLKGLKRLNKDYPYYLKRLRVFSPSLVSPNGVIFDRPVFAIDGERYRLKTKFKGKENRENLQFAQTVFLKKGEHCLNKLEDDSFKVDWVIVEPKHRKERIENRNGPKITFKKVNPAKYEVKVEEAKSPFWLVFSESFHENWAIYIKQKTENREQKPEEIVAEYPNWGVKEAKCKRKFSPADIKYLFRKPLDAEHYLANTYANGWWINSQAMNLPEDFSLIVFFRPQSLFCLGVITSGLTFAGCLLYLLWDWRKKKRQ